MDVGLLFFGCIFSNNHINLGLSLINISALNISVMKRITPVVLRLMSSTLRDENI